MFEISSAFGEEVTPAREVAILAPRPLRVRCNKETIVQCGKSLKSLITKS